MKPIQQLKGIIYVNGFVMEKVTTMIYMKKLWLLKNVYI